MSTIITSINTLTACDYFNTVQTGAQFGYSCAISGNYMVICANIEDQVIPSVISDMGAAYVSFWNGSSWTFKQRFNDSISIGSSYGSSCAIDGNYMIICASGENSNTGAAYVYYLSGGVWSLTQRLSQKDYTTSVTAGAYFGYSCAISGNYLVIAAYKESLTIGGAIDNSGAAYVYYLSGGVWSCIKRLSQKDYTTSVTVAAYFGYSCAISGSYLVIGAYMEGSSSTTVSNGYGAAYLYSLKNGICTFNKRLSAADYSSSAPVPNVCFGYSCAISGNYLVIGAYLENLTIGSSAAGHGAVYVYIFNGSTWNINKRLTMLDSGTAAVAAYFGSSCAISGSYLVIGAYYESYTYNSKSTTGSAYLFNWNGYTWIFIKKILLLHNILTLNGDSQFGISCGISGNLIVICDNNYDTNSFSNSGAAFTYYINNPQTNSIITSNIFFGNSCAISNNNIIVGNLGKAHTYNWDGSKWTTLTTLN